MEIKPDQNQINFTIAVNDVNKLNSNFCLHSFFLSKNGILSYHRANNFTRLDINTHSIPGSNTSLDTSSLVLVILPGSNLFDILLTIHSQSVLFLAQLALMDLISQAFSSFLTSTPHMYNPWNIKFVQEMPYFASADILAILEIFGTFLYPIALTLQLPIYLSIIVWEKEEKLREMMKAHGLKMSVYWLSNYIFDLLLYAIVVAFFWLSGFAVGIYQKKHLSFERFVF